MNPTAEGTVHQDEALLVETEKITEEGSVVETDKITVDEVVVETDKITEPPKLLKFNECGQMFDTKMLQEGFVRSVTQNETEADGDCLLHGVLDQVIQLYLCCI